jgi:hypothetical protein
MARFGLDAGVNFGTAIVADITKAIHDKATTGVTQPLVDKLINMDPAIIKQAQAKAGLPQTGKLDAATLDFMGKVMQVNETFDHANQVALTESEKMSELKKRLIQLDEGASPEAAKFIEKMLGIGAADVMKMTQKEFDAAFRASLNKNISKVEKRIPPEPTPTVRNNVSNNSSSTSTGGSVSNSGNSNVRIINKIDLAPIVKKLEELESKLVKEMPAPVVKELDAAVKTGDKTVITSWWERNKGKIKVGAGLTALLAAIGLGGLLLGGHENDTTTTTTTTIPPGPDGKCPTGYKLGPDGKSCVPDGTVVNPNPAPDAKPMCSLEQMDLIRQIKDEMTALNKENGSEAGVSDPAVGQALQRAQEVMDAALASCTQPTGSEQNANPAPKGVNMRGTVDLPGNVKSGTQFAGGPGSDLTQTAESADAELNRWLKIARG